MIHVQRLIFLSQHNPISAQLGGSIAEEARIQNSGVRTQKNKTSAVPGFPAYNKSYVRETATFQIPPAEAAPTAHSCGLAKALG
jgi:hypothetical protein